jgi:hypothetical protein
MHYLLQNQQMQGYLDTPSGVAERKEEASKLYKDFTGMLHKQG